jgi:hypothetical protein
MPKDGSMKLARDADLDPAKTYSVPAIQSHNLNAAVFKAIKDLETYKAAGAEDGSRMRIFAPAGSEIDFCVGGATTATSIQSSFDKTQADSPLFPFSATAQVSASQGKS